MPTTLDEIAKHTVIVADTGDIQAIAKFKPRDATTNPTLVLQAAQLPAYQNLLDETGKSVEDCFDMTV